MSVTVPMPKRPFFVNYDEVIFLPQYKFKSGSKSIEVSYRKTFPPTPDHDTDMKTLMTIDIDRFWWSKGHFEVVQDDELESGIEIWRLERGIRIPCSIERKG